MDKAREVFCNRAIGATLTKSAADRSDNVTFAFSFFCDKCGKEWRSPGVPFMSGGFVAIEHEEARALLWAKEHQAAFDRANLEASIHFNHCPVCNKWLCHDCFGMEETDNAEMCKDCAGK